MDGEKMVEPSNYDWDDAELIRLYDEGMNRVKKQIRGKSKASSSFANSSKPSPVKKGPIEWEVGDYCQAVFSEDGLMYEAIIKTINKNGTCNVEFIGYGNEEEILLEDLAPSKGAGARHEQEEIFQKDWKVGDCCWALYAEDSQWYEGKIIDIVDEETFTVKFFGYDNIEDVSVFNIKPSRRKSKSKERSHRESSVDNYSEENCSLSSHYSSMTDHSSHVSNNEQSRLLPHSHRRYPEEIDESRLSSHSYNQQHTSRRHPCVHHSNDIARRAPSLPPFPTDHGDDDTLSSLLLSWYMAGYHTGYHMGIRSRPRH